MNDYIVFMHSDAPATSDEAWMKYIEALKATGQFDGGSSIGAGLRLRKGAPDEPVSSPLAGYIRVRARSLDEARRFLDGNPDFEAGGTVEIRELPRG